VVRKDAKALQLLWERLMTKEVKLRWLAAIKNGALLASDTDLKAHMDLACAHIKQKRPGWFQGLAPDAPWSACYVRFASWDCAPDEKKAARERHGEDADVENVVAEVT